MTAQPPVNALADRIKAHVVAGHRGAMRTMLRSHSWEDLPDFVASADGAACTRLENSLNAWESGQEGGLHEEPKKDGFTHETPIRAFTTWSVEGQYALGKGFRPSLQHLIPYLNAMEGKEGWRLVQVLEAGTQTPSFLFRAERPPMYRVELPAAEDISPEFAAQISAFLARGPSDVMAKPLLQDGMVDKPHHIRRHLDALRARVDPVMPEVLEHMDDKPLIDTSALSDGVASVEETIDRVEFGTGKVLETRPLHGRRADDPVNPKHYNGTHCAEIAENLPGNLAHAITYIWRAGDKPDQPELVELDKALWWMNRELVFAKAHAEIEDDNFLLDGQMDYMNWHIQGSAAKAYQANPRKHNFYDYANGRIGVAELVGWKASAVRGMVLYAIGRKVAPLRNAIACVEQRRGTMARIRPLAEGEGSTANLEMGRSLEP